MKPTSTVKMSKKSFVKEHKELVSTLKHPTPSKLRKELNEQGKELKQYNSKKK